MSHSKSERMTIERRRQLWNGTAGEHSWRVANLASSTVWGDDRYLYSYNTVVAHRLNYLDDSIVINREFYSNNTSRHTGLMYSEFSPNAYYENFGLLERFMSVSNFVPTDMSTNSASICIRVSEGLLLYRGPSTRIIFDKKRNMYYLIVSVNYRKEIAFRLPRKPDSIRDAIGFVYGDEDVLLYSLVAFKDPIVFNKHKLVDIKRKVPWTDEGRKGYRHGHKGEYYFCGKGIVIGKKTYIRGGGMFKKTYQGMYPVGGKRKQNDYSLLWEIVVPRRKSYVQL